MLSSVRLLTSSVDVFKAFESTSSKHNQNFSSSSASWNMPDRSIVSQMSTNFFFSACLLPTVAGSVNKLVTSVCACK